MRSKSLNEEQIVRLSGWTRQCPRILGTVQFSAGRHSAKSVCDNIEEGNM